MIEIYQLYKSFDKLAVLKGVDLTIYDGEILSIIGKSGVGKSVLIKSIINLIEPDSGKIIIDNIDVTGFSEKQFNKIIRPKFSYVFQNGALWDSLTVGGNIDLALQIERCLDEKERKLRIKESLHMVELADIENVYPDELSGGMLKRVSIARAIATRPKYLLYDEPTTGLDPVLANVINNLIKKLNDELGITSVIITHDILGAKNISDRIAMLYDGRIILTCRADEMKSQDNEIFNDFIKGKVIFDDN
ncbi:ABC transporter ATP-binding protein [Melioribacteraceae bacterium 4301-Me]|uniref:ABC transporter ATP-binding protein n=1 Tax=Pyranulibacter aquaticus TaxID=3163344 RepID=UPI00359B5950